MSGDEISSRIIQIAYLPEWSSGPNRRLSPTPWKVSLSKDIDALLRRANNPLLIFHSSQLLLHRTIEYPVQVSHCWVRRYFTHIVSPISTFLLSHLTLKPPPCLREISLRELRPGVSSISSVGMEVLPDSLKPTVQPLNLRGPPGYFS